MAIGDRAITYDPITAHGANSASKMAQHVLQRIVQRDRDEQPFDAEWMTTVFEDFWEKDAQYACAFTSALLVPITR